LGTIADRLCSKKKKWSKGKVKDKANNAVVLDKPILYVSFSSSSSFIQVLMTVPSDKIMKEVPTYRVITTSTLIDRMKINGSLARRAIAHLEKEGSIKRVVHSNAQLVYTRATTGKE